MAEGRTGPSNPWAGVALAQKKLGLRDVRGADVFAGLSPSQIVAILARGQLQRHKTGSFIYRADTNQEGLYFLQSGLVEEYRLTADGYRLLLSQISPGQFFGVATSPQAKYCCFAEASRDSEVIFLSFRELESVCKDYPEVAINLLRWVAHRLGEIEERFQAMSFGRLRNRVARTLIELAERQGSPIKMTQESLSSWVPASRSRVNIVLGELEEAGAVRLSKGEIHILDIKLLRERADRPV